MTKGKTSSADKRTKKPVPAKEIRRQRARALAEALNGPGPVVTGHYRLGDVRHITADSSRLWTELGWRPKVDFADGTTMRDTQRGGDDGGRADTGVRQ